MINPAAHLVNLAMECLQKNDLVGAERLLRKAQILIPKDSELIRLLGVLFAFQNNKADALNMFDRSVKIEPKNWLAHLNRGNILKDLHKYAESMKCYDLAISLQPNHPEAYNNKGNLLQDLKKYDEALSAYEKAISLQPNYAEAYGNLGNALQNLNRIDEALRAYQIGIDLDQEGGVNPGALVHCKMKLCDWTGIEDRFEKISSSQSFQRTKIHPFHLLPFLDNPIVIKKFTEEYVSSEYFPRMDLGEIARRDHSKKIRIGYFSADFKNHPVSFLITGMLDAHNKNDFELISFSTNVKPPDEITETIKNYFDEFIDVSLMSDYSVARLARDKEIDIAVDLGGITQDARLGIFSYRVAPIQIGYIGYLGTLAAPYMDYIIADKTIIPDNMQDAYSEKIIYLPSYQANDDRTIISEKVFTREELGLPERGFVYCCFNNSYKITPTIFDSWAKILIAVPDSSLLLYADSESVKLNLTKEIERRGVNGGRVIFADRLKRDKYLARYRIADLFLDTSPYNAGTTASDALWAGLPVLTFLGQSFSARMCGSLLNAIGMPELVASSQKEYEDLAISIGRDSEKISKLKNKLAINRRTMPLFDTKLFTESVESAYKKIYERNLNGLIPEHINI
jgi:protein O-GlcNAc transferase